MLPLPSTSYNTTSDRIIPEATFLNGREDLTSPDSMALRVQIQERVAIRNKATTLQEPLVGIWQESAMSRAYFSEANTQRIQNALRAEVYEQSNKRYVIPPQNVDTLHIIMRSIYLQYAEHYETPTQIRQEIGRLNRLVLDYAVASCYREAEAYEQYIQDISSPVVPLGLPQQERQYEKQLEFKRFF